MEYFSAIAFYYYTIIIVVAIFIFRQYQKSTNTLCVATKKLNGRTAIVTGGTAGIGFEVAKDLARRGARVVIACPFLQEGLDAQKSIVEETGNKNVVFKLLDLTSLKSVRLFAADILKSENRLDLLINNAGVTLREDALTEDGFNITMAINYYGHFLLTVVLLPLLKKSGHPSEPSRIINTSSVLHWIGSFDPDTMNIVGVNRLKYANSKFCTLLFSHELSRRLRGAPVVSNTVDPGAVGTGIFKPAGKLYATFTLHFFDFMFKTAWEGAQTTLHVALDSKAGEVSGKHFMNCKEFVAKPSAFDDKLAAELWAHSVKLVKLTEPELK